jgi:transcriptional regulator with XRE-family HTH domain
VDELTIGARLRTLRRWRGMTQAELAGLAGVSFSFISMVERGERALDRRSHIAALASALKVSEADLVGGPHLSADRVQADPHMGIPPLRVALQTNSLNSPATEHARPLEELAAELSGTIVPLRRDACDYVRVGQLLPSLIDEVYVHAAQPEDERAQRLALETLIEACVCATAMCWGLDHFDLAQLAAVRGQEAASMLGDPVHKGKADWAWLLSLPRAGGGNRKLAAAARVACELEQHARSPLGQQVLGMVTLTASMAAAALQCGSSASHWMDEAQAIAARVPDDPAGNWEQFSTTNVGVWKVAVGVERGEAGGAVLERARNVNAGLLAAKSSRRAAFLADVGRGLAREPRTRTEAVRWLRQAEQAAPQRIRNSSAVRETVAFLLNRATTASVGRELRGMAARMGMPH